MYTIVFFLWWFYEIYHMITLDSYKYLIRGISNKYSEKKVKSEWDSISITVSIIYSIRSSQVLNQCIDRSQMLPSKPMSKHPYLCVIMEQYVLYHCLSTWMFSLSRSFCSFLLLSSSFFCLRWRTCSSPSASSTTSSSLSMITSAS